MSTLKVNTITPISGDTVNVDGDLTVGGSPVSGFPFTGSAAISGSFLVTGSSTLALRVSGSTALTGSLFVSGTISGSFIGDGSGLTGIVTASHTAGTASFADYATSASYAISASHEISYETSSSLAETASFARTGDGIFSGSFSGSYVGDGSTLTGISSYTVANSANNRILTSVDADNGNAEANLTFDGSTLTVAGSINETSAARFKENIQPLNDSLSKVIQLNPVEYDWKRDGKHDLGLIAEEVYEIFPDLVSKDGRWVQGISYSRLTAVLIGAIKELSTRVEELENQ